MSTTNFDNQLSGPEGDSAIQVYLAMLRLSDPTEAALEADGFTIAQIREARNTLLERRLIEASGDSFEVPPPEVTLPAYAAELERQARTSRAAVTGLSRMYHRARAETDRFVTSELETRAMRSIEELLRHALRLVASANTSIVQLAARSRVTDDLLLTGRLPTPGPNQRSVVHDVAVDTTFLEVDGSMNALGALRDSGIHVWLVPAVPFSALVVDGSSAILDVSNIQPSGIGSVLLRHPPHVQAVAAVLDRMIRTAVPLPRKLGDVLPGTGSARDTQILSLLAAGASDSTIARQVGVSQRTVERRLRTIMDSLGATTRFQGGVQAVRRGLI